MASDGIRRRRCGRGFLYLGPDGEPVRDEATLARIRALAIPPAWRDVWIDPRPRARLQATGIDAAGRKQYRYHESWLRRAAQRKFATVRRFGAELPRLRRAVSRDLGREGMPPERALACAVRLLDRGLFRVGGEEYAEENGSFGVATLRREHLRVSDGEAVFDFPAKSGLRRRQSIRDAAAVAALEEMRRRRGGPDDLLAYRRNGGWSDLRSEEVNAYIQAKAGPEFSAKDFRTWHATVFAAVELAGPPPASSRAREAELREAICHVAELLGNTPAVCRTSYVDPLLIDRYRDGQTIAATRADGANLGERLRSRVEREVLELLG